MNKVLLNKATLVLCALLFLFLAGCASPNKQVTQEEPLQSELPIIEEKQEPILEPAKEVEQVTPPAPTPQPTVDTDLEIIGEVEPVTIIAATTTFPARIDTGATTTSIDAHDIQEFERDGKSWVKFKVKDRQTGKVSQLESRVTRIVEIKRHGTDPQNRLVVKLKAKLGSKTMNVEFSLADRSSFEYPVLVGRNILSGNFVVDVAQKNVTSLMKED